MIGRKDFRTPADPEDFESFMTRRASPPMDIQVFKSKTQASIGGVATELTSIRIKGHNEPPGRERTVRYRIYFIGDAVIPPSRMGDPSYLKDAYRLGSIVAEIGAPTNGEQVVVDDTQNVGKAGWYFGVGLNRRGDESEPTPPGKAPW